MVNPPPNSYLPAIEWTLVSSDQTFSVTPFPLQLGCRLRTWEPEKGVAVQQKQPLLPQNAPLEREEQRLKPPLPLEPLPP